MSLLAMDLLGPFPPSTSGKRVIIVVTDYATRYVVTGALNSGSAMDVAEFLVERVICQLGCFRYILSDNGTCFRSKLMSELGKTLGFKQKFTSIFHPRCDGLVERFNFTLSRMLAAFIPDAGFNEWDKFLQPVTFAHNTSLHATLKEIPFTLMFARDAVLPQDLNLRLHCASLPADHIRDRIREAFAHARKALEARQSYDKGRHDVKHPERSFHPGDKVVLEVPIRAKGIPDKLQPKARGPYKIISRHPNRVTYVIETIKRGKPERVTVHVSRLHPYQEPLEISDPTNVEPTAAVGGDEPIPIKRVTKKRVSFQIPPHTLIHNNDTLSPRDKVDKTKSKKSNYFKAGETVKGGTSHVQVNNPSGASQSPEQPLQFVPRRSARIQEILQKNTS